MKRRALLRGLLTVPIAGALGAGASVRPNNREQTQESAPSSLKVVIDGAFALVIQRDRRCRVRAFTPVELNGRHIFSFFDGPASAGLPSSFRQGSTNQNHHFELFPDGIQPQSRPDIDPALVDFVAHTSKWCQEDYFVTIDLPVPKRITFMPPAWQVDFKDGRKGCMAFNHVLEYDVLEPAKLRMSWQDVKDFPPLTPADLIAQYERNCLPGLADKKKKKQCFDQQNIDRAFFKESDRVFFFGVGLPPSESHDEKHPVEFFNKRILPSFPDLKGQFEIEKIHDDKPFKKQAQNSAPHLMPAVLTRPTPPPRVNDIYYSAVVDCKASGPIVTFPS